MSGSPIVEHPVRFDFLSLDKASLVVVRLFAGSQKRPDAGPNGSLALDVVQS